mmetsp:Transcript_90030/g.259480  ORF Transcript_90030/g.259480 Transcript_90030/m.259480 type:complete len:225 (-) Transcript_90030:444-1118(-)
MTFGTSTPLGCRRDCCLENRPPNRKPPRARGEHTVARSDLRLERRCSPARRPWPHRRGRRLRRRCPWPPSPRPPCSTATPRSSPRPSFASSPAGAAAAPQPPGLASARWAARPWRPPSGLRPRPLSVLAWLSLPTSSGSPASSTQWRGRTSARSPRPARRCYRRRHRHGRGPTSGSARSSTQRGCGRPFPKGRRGPGVPTWRRPQIRPLPMEGRNRGSPCRRRM